MYMLAGLQSRETFINSRSNVLRHSKFNFIHSLSYGNFRANQAPHPRLLYNNLPKADSQAKPPISTTLKYHRYPAHNSQNTQLSRKHQDLVAQRCINIRFPTYGCVDAWELKRRGKKLKVRGDGQQVFNTTTHVANAVAGGMGTAYLPEEEFSPHIAEGKLMRVLEDWCTPFSGNHLFYPSRRQPSPAFSLVVDALRVDRRSRRSYNGTSSRLINETAFSY